VITTPNFTHAAMLADALATDKHVLIEKPLCTTVDDCLRWSKRPPTVMRSRGWACSTGTCRPPRRCSSNSTGVCGTTRMVSIREHRFPFLKKVGDWNRFSRNTGGTLVEKCCHFFDLMHLARRAHPVRVMASGGQDVNHLDEVLRDRRSQERPTSSTTPS
jgi:myo-inositol 2-dehydrogenase/D-chiro-inositol 1-dehydrogenase